MTDLRNMDKKFEELQLTANDESIDGKGISKPAEDGDHELHDAAYEYKVKGEAEDEQMRFQPLNPEDIFMNHSLIQGVGKRKLAQFANIVRNVYALGEEGNVRVKKLVKTH